MAIISPSTASGGRNTGFSYVFNASRAVFQDSVQSVAAKSVIHKGKDIGSSRKYKSESTGEKIKDDVTCSASQMDNVSETSAAEKLNKNRTKSVHTAGCSTSPSNVVSRTDRTNTPCSNKTVSDNSESQTQKKPNSNKCLPISTSDAKSVKENANVTDVGIVTPTTGLSVTKGKITENTSETKTSAQNCQLENTQNSSPKPLISKPRPSKVQMSVKKTEKSQTVAGKTSKYQINCDKGDKLGEQNQKDNTNEHIIKSNAETTSSCAMNSKTFDEKNKRESFINNKSSSKKYLKDEKINRSAIQQKDVGQSDIRSGSTENIRESDAREKLQSSENRGTAKKLQTVVAKSSINVRSKENIIVNSTNKSQSENLQTDKEAKNKKLNIKSQKESTSKTSSEKPQWDGDKITLVEQTISKYKRNVAKPYMDSGTDESVTKCQKDIQDSASKVLPQKAANSKVGTKPNEKSVVNSVKETTPISPNQTSVDKITNAKSQAQIEISSEKFKQDVKDEIGSSRQLTKSFATPQGHDAKKELDGKDLSFQKETTDSPKEKTLPEKPQTNNSKNEKSIVKTNMPTPTGKPLAKKSQKEDVKNETSRQLLTKLDRDTTHFVNKPSVEKLKEGDLTTEKLPKDDIKPDVTSQRHNSQRCPSKTPLEKIEIDKLKVEKSEKPILKLQKDSTENVIGKSTGKPLQDGLTEKHNEKQVEKPQKDVQNVIVTDSLQPQKEKVLTDKTIDKPCTKTQKDMLSSISNKSTKEQEVDNNKSHTDKRDHPGKKISSKSDQQSSVSKNPTRSTPKESDKEQFSEKPIVTSQKDNTEKLSYGSKISVEKNGLSGAKIYTVESQKDIVQDNSSKTMVACNNNKDTIPADTLRIDRESNLNGEISAVKRRTDIISHRSAACETYSQSAVEKCPTSFQTGSEKGVPDSEVSKLSIQECKKHNVKTTGMVSSQTHKDNTYIKSTVSSPKSKLEFDKMVECKDRNLTTITQPDHSLSKIGAENSAEIDKLSKLQCSHSDSSETSGVNSGKICEMNSLNMLQSHNNDKFVGDFKFHDLGLRDKYKDIVCQDKVTHPSHSTSTFVISSINPINSQSLKDDFQLASAIYTTQEQSVKNRRHIKENRPCSYPSTEHKDFSGLQQRSSSQQSLDYYARDCTLSAVDYAKSRFQNVQQIPRSDEVIKPKPKHTQMVNEFKSLWENYEQKVAGFSIPHPKSRKIYMRRKLSFLSPEGQCDADFPIRPFLTKGSVAERVLLFECCPDRALDRSSGKSKSLLYNTWKSAGLHHKTRSFYIQRDKENLEPSKAAAFCRFSKSSNVFDIPLFHYPKGRPLIKTDAEKQLKEIKAVFSAFTDEKVTKEEFGIITKACNLPLYWKLPLFLSAAGENKPFLKCDVFLQYWRRIISIFHDEASQLIAVLTKCCRNYLLPDDFISMIQDIIDTHPGLTFLKEATEFHSRYVHTVISRIYYCVNKSWSGKITVAELRKSNFLQIVSLLEKEDDINQITDYFSYEHFYVIYCKFWELDKDHDLFIDKNDLKRHNDGAISSRMLERIFSGAVTRSPSYKDGKMSYTDFVWFLFSEEDKRHPRSIEYWFRCMDLDGDGYLSMYEMEYFYEEQLQRMEALSIETLPFKDCLCQMLDMIRPKIPGLISLSDLKKCKMTPLFFDTFFNLEKYLDYEQRDPFASQREQDNDSGDMSDWDRYASEEYELLVAEEGSSEQSDDLMYEDYTQEEEELSSGAQKITGASIINHSRSAVDATDEEYADTDLTYY